METYAFARYVKGKFTGMIHVYAASIQEGVSKLSDSLAGVFLYVCTVKDK